MAAEKKEWIVRGGVEALVRPDRPRAQWEWHTLRKPTYFYENELVSGPEAESQNRWWTFSRDGWLISVAERDFYSRP